MRTQFNIPIKYINRERSLIFEFQNKKKIFKHVFMMIGSGSNLIGVNKVMDKMTVIICIYLKV